MVCWVVTVSLWLALSVSQPVIDKRAAAARHEIMIFCIIIFVTGIVLLRAHHYVVGRSKSIGCNPTRLMTVCIKVISGSAMPSHGAPRAEIILKNSRARMKFFTACVAIKISHFGTRMFRSSRKRRRCDTTAPRQSAHCAQTQTFALDTFSAQL